jgi:Mg2+ and Co2+ transporter CorA
LLNLQKLVTVDSIQREPGDEPKPDRHWYDSMRWHKKQETSTSDSLGPEHAAVNGILDAEKTSVDSFASDRSWGSRHPTSHTLHRQRRGVNDERALFMERNSPLRKKGLTVAVEQVSIFLTEDNVVICIFEYSADDVEEPILRRLHTPDTILRRSADGSMLVQAIIDAIIDLFFAVSSAYEVILSELELEVLTSPQLKHSKTLYMVSADLTDLRNNIQPIANVVAALRDHKKDSALPDGPNKTSRFAGSAITISPLAHTYLGDVEDHVLQISQNLDILRYSISNMIDLIFNQVSAFQNETMERLTFATIIFLPLTFLTGYFGQNFDPFPVLKNGTDYFWKWAVPAVLCTMIMLSYRSSLCLVWPLP